MSMALRSPRKCWPLTLLDQSRSFKKVEGKKVSFDIEVIQKFQVSYHSDNRIDESLYIFVLFLYIFRTILLEHFTLVITEYHRLCSESFRNIPFEFSRSRALCIFMLSQHHFFNPLHASLYNYVNVLFLYVYFLF